MFVDDPKTNGTEVIDLVDTTPEKKPPPLTPKEKVEDIAPRRSTRNLNKSKSYVESDKEDTPPPPPPPATSTAPPADQEDVSEESDIEEVMPQDPLGE